MSTQMDRNALQVNDIADCTMYMYLHQSFTEYATHTRLS